MFLSTNKKDAGAAHTIISKKYRRKHFFECRCNNLMMGFCHREKPSNFLFGEKRNPTDTPPSSMQSRILLGYQAPANRMKCLGNNGVAE
jgi:hypothetical protein